MAKPAQHEFTPINDEKSASRYIQYILDLNCDVSCAVRETNIRFDSTPVRLIGGKMLHLRYPSGLMAPEAMKEIILKTKLQKIDISYKAQDILIFASTSFRQLDKEAIGLEVGFPIYKLQRRESLRVKPGPDIECSVEIFSDLTKNTDAFRPYDVSTSGFALMVSDEEMPRFPKGLEISRIAFRFGPQEALVNAKVMSVVAVKGPRRTQHKIGFQIAQVPPGLEKEISRYAYLATQKILSRRI